MIHQEFSFELHHEEFHGQYWHSTKIKAVILLVHGMGEHSTRYANFVVPTLVDNGYAVISYDNFGHGKSSGKRGHCPSFTAVLDCVEKVAELSNELFVRKPIYLYGHSMGGNVVINYALRKVHNFKGVIATSPFLKLAIKPPVIKLFMGRLLQKIAPSTTMGNEIDPNDISRDEKEVEKYINDPLIHDKISPNFSITFIKTGKWAIKNAGMLEIPMLLMHGTGDKIIDYKGSQAFANKTDKATLKLYEGGYHELHNDLCKKEMMADMVTWLENQQ